MYKIYKGTTDIQVDIYKLISEAINNGMPVEEIKQKYHMYNSNIISKALEIAKGISPVPPLCTVITEVKTNTSAVDVLKTGRLPLIFCIDMDVVKSFNITNKKIISILTEFNKDRTRRIPSFICGGIDHF